MPADRPSSTAAPPVADAVPTAHRALGRRGEATDSHEGFPFPTQAQTLAWRRWKGLRTDLDATVMKLAEEAGEVVAAVLKMQEGRPGFDQDHLALELAQVVICCMGAAEAAGVDLDSAVRGYWKAASSGMPDV